MGNRSRSKRYEINEALEGASLPKIGAYDVSLPTVKDPHGYLAMYLEDKNAKSCVSLHDKPPPLPPPRQFKPSLVQTRSWIDDEDKHWLDRSLSVIDAKAVRACVSDHQRINSELVALHAKVAAAHEALAREQVQRKELLAAIAGAEALAPVCHDRRATHETQLRVLENAIASTAADSRKQRAQVAAAKVALEAVQQRLHSGRTAVAEEAAIRDAVQHEHATREAVSASVAAAMQRMEVEALRRDAALREIQTQCDDEAKRLAHLKREAKASATRCQSVAQFVSQCTREYAERGFALPPIER
ncbi:hypothetical protein SDRG_04189 [Saprolegnia diclina VS20]|uniref:Uncharacterized protein n=1 Tax=Saprolegnia diclina (strain VS20) TaxID=1156394 RepID=T0QV16_SAPDV|nr:hypothetical protein SDRG_04189 [Saprolegnia diclina VS20]EQC38481.1 hypothetical protein SDRG_04189 [Saprolegnia diclina VS20]|eukprot:XP_008608073.1 hypothetical protein SDRG_04189 [Saprolegnia diclina VS20]